MTYTGLSIHSLVHHVCSMDMNIRLGKAYRRRYVDDVLFQSFILGHIKEGNTYVFVTSLICYSDPPPAFFEVYDIQVVSTLYIS